MNPGDLQNKNPHVTAEQEAEYLAWRKKTPEGTYTAVEMPTEVPRKPHKPLGRERPADTTAAEL